MGISQGMGSAALLPAGFGFRNLIINGDMRINQRGFIATVNYGVTHFVYDRWGAYYNAINVVEYLASTDTPNGTLFAGSIKCAVSGASGGFSDFSEAYIQQKIEGHNCRPLSWGSSEAKSAVLSFWVKSNVTGTYSVSFLNNAEDRVYVATYTIDSSNMWEQKFITVPGDTGGSWAYTNTVGVNVRFNLDSTPGQSGSANVWRATAGAPSTAQTSLMETDGAQFLLTGVQLEQNYQVTPFEHRPIGVELALCQRYYYRASIDATNRAFCLGWADSATVFVGTVPFPQRMRTRPTALETTGTASNYMAVGPAATMTATSVVFDGTTSDFQGTIVLSGGGGLTTGRGGQIRSNTSSTSYFAWSAEL